MYYILFFLGCPHLKNLIIDHVTKARPQHSAKGSLGYKSEIKCHLPIFISVVSKPADPLGR